MNKENKTKNYVIEDNIDFYSALNDSDEENENTNMCLISQNILDENAITLNCGHSFNYIDLYNEVKKQKSSKNLTLDKNIQQLKKNEYICPYCRTRQHSLLPHVKDENIQYISGVNAPFHACMPFHHCSYITKSGKNKGIPCKEHALMKNNLRLCSRHSSYIIKYSNKKNLESHEKCCAVLKFGIRKGQHCGAKIHNVETQTCKRHTT